MQFLQMIWNGISDLGVGTVILKGLFILLIGAIFWMLCELAKYLVKILVKLAEDALRYLAIIVRGWPENGEEAVKDQQGSHWSNTNKDSR